MLLTRIYALTAIAMFAFASNSLLCRIALKQTAIDAASFTSLRLIAGAITLCILVHLKQGAYPREGNWISALALFIYAAAFSFAYVKLSAGTGALLLFGAVQATMIMYGLYKGERLRALQMLGLAFAIAGLIFLVLPGLSAPPVAASLWMLSAGFAWGVYSLRGKATGDPTRVTAGNFLRTVPMALALSVAMWGSASLDSIGVTCALASGALASGLGYAIWYKVLPLLKATHAASVQLSVPVIAALGGIVFLAEPASLRLVAASLSVLGGIALTIGQKRGSN